MSREFVIDWEREARTGAAEAIFCESKSVAQIAAILRDAAGQRLFLTRLSGEALAVLPSDLAASLDYDPISRSGIFGVARPVEAPRVCLVAAGTSDLPVVREAARALAFHCRGTTLVTDVGVAGLWRLMARIEEIRSYDVVIAVAGMEGALFSVLAGLISAPVVAVPTSVGYGVARGGRAALTGALASCVPGLVAVNIDNGYGAACAALRILQTIDRAVSPKAKAARSNRAESTTPRTDSAFFG